MTNFIVKSGMSIFDVSMNATGSASVSNVNKILLANLFLSWNIELYDGQIIQIPDDCFFDLNTKRTLEKYPASNNLSKGIQILIENVFNQIYENWILRTGFWDDNSTWIDTKNWID